MVISWRGRGRRTIATIVAGGLVSCLAVAVPFVLWVFDGAGEDALRRGLLCAVVLPLIIGIPWFLFLSMKMRDLANLNATLRYAASHDDMTGLLNWSAFHRKLQAASGGGALLLVDIDHFKAINDRWGHPAGDAMLRCVADTLARVVGDRGFAGRLGGEEFGVFLPAADAASATAIAGALRGDVAICRTSDAGATGIALTVSIGVVAYPAAVDHQVALQQADRLLYRAKANGRDRIEIESLPRIDIGDAPAASAAA